MLSLDEINHVATVADVLAFTIASRWRRSTPPGAAPFPTGDNSPIRRDPR
jgi:hypothetical protein